MPNAARGAETKRKPVSLNGAGTHEETVWHIPSTTPKERSGESSWHEVTVWHTDPVHNVG